MAADLEEIGVPEEQLAAWRAAAEQQLDAVEEEPFEVWEENRETVAVFQHCHWQTVGVGMAGARYTGIETSEVRNVMDVLEVPPERRQDVLAGVRFMVSVALPLLNRENT